MLIREANAADVPEIVAILNADTLTNPSSWRIEPETEADREGWLESRRATGHPVLVAEEDGRVLGFASCGPFRPFDAWAGVVEHSIYLHRDAQGLGLGKQLLPALMHAIADAGFTHVAAVIDSANEPSLRLHRNFGFEDIGRMNGVGKKPSGILDADFLLYDLKKLDRDRVERDECGEGESEQ